jgi:ADP-ribose diphosphatase
MTLINDPVISLSQIDCSKGMTTANMKLVVLDVDVDSLSDELPFQKLEDGEHIVRRIVELDELNAALQGGCSARTSPRTM